MKSNFKTSPILTSGDMESSKMDMDSTGMDIACMFLRSKIYSDKSMAVVREYAINSTDEHIKFSIQKPAEIILESDNILKFRDFAKGLDEHDIRNVFGMYFKSTKTKNNEQTGGLGIGGKCAMCYTDTFFVKSHFEGILTTYACSLGGGDKGIPVGQIFKISEEPTDESGLEVSLEIQKSDRQEFIRNVRQFIRFCKPNTIIFKCDGIEYAPPIPVKEIKIQDYTIKLFHNPSIGRQYSFTMGNICYDTRLSIHNCSCTILQDHYIVVDIPIGKMSIPISRESFENTPANTRVLNEIYGILKDLENEDMCQFQKVSVPDLMDTFETQTVKGEWFETQKSKLYKDVYPVISAMCKSYFSRPLEKDVNGKYLVALLPDKKTYESWKDKFTDHCVEIDKNYYTLRESYLCYTTIDRAKLDQYFSFKPFKSVIFQWPKKVYNKDLADFDKAFVCKFYDRYAYGRKVKSITMTALELHNKARKEMNLPEATSGAEALQQMQDLEIDSFDDLYKFSIEVGPSDSQYVTVKAEQMYENMLSIGWYGIGSPEYAAIADVLRQKQTEKNARDLLVQNTQIRFLRDDIREKIRLKVEKNDRRCQQLSERIAKIKEEQSLRGTIFRAMTSNCYYNRIDRHELRKILQLK
jgi:hypothetical protein